jgi:hypothetical protein
LVVLQRKLASLHSQSRGLWQRKSDAEKERDILSGKLMQMRKQQDQWTTVGPPSGVRYEAEAAAWNATLNDRHSAAHDVQWEIEQLDSEIAALKSSYDELMTKARPLREVVSNCERAMGRADVVLRGVLTGAVDGGGAEFAAPPASPEPTSAGPGQSAANATGLSSSFVTAARSILAGARQIGGGGR